MARDTLGSMRRPNTIVGLLVRLVRLHPRRAGVAIGIPLLVTALVWPTESPAVRVATFNIENYPQSARQEEGAFALIGQLSAPVVAVQEITDPQRFATTARERLGERWHFTYDQSSNRQRVGVLYDSTHFQLGLSRTHFGTVVYDGGKPALEVQLTRRDGGPALRVIVVHLKAGGNGVAMRRRQLQALRPIMRRALDTPDRVVLLGDFNTTGDEDRAMIHQLSRELDMVWASSELECTMYWDRGDACLGQPLDHILTRDPVHDIRARGPCETDGCHPGDRCPIFHREVSDHCPVTVVF